MKHVIMQYHEPGKWVWNSDKQVEVYVDGQFLGTYVGMRPEELLKVLRKKLKVTRVKSSVVQWISPVQRAKEDLEYKVRDVYCPVETFWENVGKQWSDVMARLGQIANMSDENQYNEALVSLMNEYI